MDNIDDPIRLDYSSQTEDGSEALEIIYTPDRPKPNIFIRKFEHRPSDGDKGSIRELIVTPTDKIRTIVRNKMYVDSQKGNNLIVGKPYIGEVFDREMAQQVREIVADCIAKSKLDEPAADALIELVYHITRSVPVEDTKIQR